VDELGDMLSRKFAVQENTFKELPREANSSNESVNHREGKANLEKVKNETVNEIQPVNGNTVEKGTHYNSICMRVL
jgi:hypothetical protein